MPLRSIYVFVILTFLFVSTLQAQKEETLQEITNSEEFRETYRIYDTQKYEAYLCGTGSGKPMDMRRDWSKLVREVEDKVSQVEQEIEITPITIEVLFHVLSTKDRLSITRSIATQIEALNRDFNNKSNIERHPNDPEGKYLKLAASAELNFKLAEHSEARLGEGIVTVREGDKWEDWDQMKNPEYGGSAAIDPSKYLNIWICDLPPDKGSYSSSPYIQTGDDGIVIDARFFGLQEDSNYNQGKTLTHLVGNYLGLLDLWSDADYCVDDRVADTPIHHVPHDRSHDYHHRSACPGYPTTMTMNFMDATRDVDQVMFTKGQVERMHSMMYTVRRELLRTTKSTGI